MSEINKEALFNEVKGSLFEFLVAREIALKNQDELSFLKNLDKNYMSVLSQQDRMVRQFYPEMHPFLSSAAKLMAGKIENYFESLPHSPRLVGKLSNSSLRSELHEADLILMVGEKSVPLSLKLNKKKAFVNTKSGGIKSFFSNYFSVIPGSVQTEFNQFVDMEFTRMAHELHSAEDIEFNGNFDLWVRRGYSELPGELNETGRTILKEYYARIALRMHEILSGAFKENPEGVRNSLLPLMGFGNREIVQGVCYHDFNGQSESEVAIFSVDDILPGIHSTEILPFNHISSVELKIGEWDLQLRVKPMNKFTTTAIKINCSVRKPISF